MARRIPHRAIAASLTPDTPIPRFAIIPLAMPTLSQLSPLRRLALLRRAPFWAQAAAICALFAIVGVAVVDDYGIASDERPYRNIVIANADYVAGDTAKLSQHKDPSYRYYGVAFSMPLLALERALGLQDTRHIYLMRHLLTHLFFIAGGFACGMLAYRMFGSRWIALLAMLTFLLHPRLYAHSFFNAKDIPFVVMFMIALYLTHRAFRKDAIGAFLLCGIGVGLAMNLRPFALMLPPMILSMRALDLWQAGNAERKRILMTSAAFLAAALATLYITHPYYWENPLRLIEGARALSQHPTTAYNLFMGEIYRSDAVPWNFIPVWFAITAPPVTLALSALGAAAVCWQGAARPLAALRDREIRFRLLLLGCFALPVVVVIALQSNIYSAWRQMYFLWTPFCLLAAVGIHTIANIRMWEGIRKIGARLPGRVHGGGCRLHAARRALAYGAAGVGLITTLTAMAALHPHQQVYFNALVDTETPGALVNQYDMDYWRVSHRQLVEHLLARYPDDILRVWPGMQRDIFPQRDRERIVHASARYPNADFYLNWRYIFYRREAPDSPTLHSIGAYGSDISFIIAPNSDAYRDYHSAKYNDVEANGTLLAHADVDIYIHDGALHYLIANCAPMLTNHRATSFLHIFPADPADLPADSRERGFENRDFRIGDIRAFFTHTVFFDDKCIVRRPLPDYPIARVRTGQTPSASGGGEWRADIDLAAHAAARAAYDSIAAGDYGAPVAQSHFDVYIRGDALAYLKEPCTAGEADARFFLHIFPADPADLPAAWRKYGFVNLDFQFADHGADIGGMCVAEHELPAYPIERVRTGQNAAQSSGDGWRVDINLAAHAAAQSLYDGIAAGDYGQPAAQSGFDVYLRDGVLAYLKENCAPGDADARFFLHIIPADSADLPAAARERGFANLDFQFADHGARAGDICVATRELPDYPIARVRTGQNAANSGEWRADINLAAHAAAQAAYDSIAARDYGQPMAQSGFDVYLRGNALTYIKESCAPGDADARFFLHIIPDAPTDLPAAARERGFANLDFQFADRGAYAGDICVATLDLPDYPIDRIRTGQFVSGAGQLWGTEFPVAR